MPVVAESSSSEDEDQPDTSPVHSGLEDMQVELEHNPVEPSSRPPSPQPIDNPPSSLEMPAVNTDLSTALGAKPSDIEIQGEQLHEEIVSRWEYYLKKGVKKEERQKIIAKYPIPKNNPALAPPKINDEVLDCLNDSVNKKDYFLRSLQHQMGHGLTAMGIVMETLIKENHTETKLSCLADAALLFTNVHNALSMLRKQNILPLLNAESRRVGFVSQLDSCLFGEKFGEAVKNKQNLKKTSNELKNRSSTYTRPSGTPSAGPSSARPSTSTRPSPGPSSYNPTTRYLNYRRGERNTRMKTDNLYKSKRTSTRDQSRKHQIW